MVPSNPSNYTLEFQTAETVLVKADCNTGSGSYKVEGSSITFGPMAMTRMMCPPGSLDTKFLQGLGAARIYRVALDHMMFDLAADSGTMLFARAVPAASGSQ